MVPVFPHIRIRPCKFVRINPVIQRPAGIDAKAGLQLPSPTLREGKHQIRPMEKSVHNPFPPAAQTVIKGKILGPMDMYNGLFSRLFYFFKIKIFSKGTSLLRSINMKQIVFPVAEQKSEIPENGIPQPQGQVPVYIGRENVDLKFAV